MSDNFPGKKIDFIIAGAGCAGLSLVMRMIRSGKFHDKKILVIDKESKVKNDRTWCFWEKDQGFFGDIVSKKWSALHFFSDTFSLPLDIGAYQYKMIRGVDLYNYCFAEIKKQENVEILTGAVNRITTDKNKVTIDLDNRQLHFEDAVVFNSIYKPGPRQKDKIYLLQHFKGWIIETDKPSFNPCKATFMDFRVQQDQGTTFAYMLPLTETKALVEYTLFTENLLDKKQYNKELEAYIRDFLKIDSYKIIEEEFGVIPMTNESFNFYKDGTYYIGTAGGQTKASSGYTFQFIQKQTQNIVDCLIAGNPLSSIRATPKRFHFYDTVLLRLLQEGKLPGREIFSKLFQRNKASHVFRFLDNETSFVEELKIISSLQTIPFLKAALKK